MKIKSVHLENIGRFGSLELRFAPYNDKPYNNTVIIGNNGAGKSTILESIALSLSWFVARIKNEKGVGTPISELKINNESHTGLITLNVENGLSTYSWTTAKVRKGKRSPRATHLEELNELINLLRDSYTVDDKASFPLILFYDANRGVLDIPLKIRGKHTFTQIDGYDNALRGMVDYRRFFEWYREREDVENESKIRILNTIKPGKFTEDVFTELNKMADNQLFVVRKALEIFLPGLTNFRIERKPRLHMAVDKEGKALNVEQLSQGEKLTMALVGDIARRLAIMNPGMDDPLQGDGIILLDEAELHLHPRWQRTLISRLGNTFPNCQFIMTTHSPLLISDDKDVLCYSLDHGEIYKIDSLYGEDVNHVLINAMNTYARNPEIDQKIKSFMDAVQDRDIESANVLLSHLEDELPQNHMELIKSRLLIKRLELINEKNK